MDFDPVLLSRFQFAWLIGWHILMPAFTVGMASYIAILEGFHFATGRQIYLRISMFWIRIFSVAFGVGVVSGVIMPFQFGTNWSRYADATSNVLGPLFAYEAINALGGLPGRASVRPKAGAAVGAFHCRPHGGPRNALLRVLDSRRQ